jgi:threonine-phosphate decarboxylase
MRERIHGGDWAAYQSEYGAVPLDFSASVSPLGVPEGVRRAIAEAAGEADRYPDPDCRALRAAIAAREGVTAGEVLCGAGAGDLIYRAVFAAKPRRALVTAPCFGEYEAAVEAAGGEIVRVALNEAFRPDERLLSAADGVGMVILCQPNNPTGLCIDPALLRRIVLRCAERSCRVLVDECFIGFLDVPETYSMKPLLRQCPNLLIVNAFTKLHALAGVRLGWALGADAAFLDAMRRAGPPWAVSHLAQAAGLAALADADYVRRVRELVRRERPRLRGQLAALGLRVVPGEANFLLFRCETPLTRPLRERGILIRSCADFVGLDRTWYRVAVRTREENGRLIAALGEVLG